MKYVFGSVLAVLLAGAILFGCAGTEAAQQSVPAEQPPPYVNNFGQTFEYVAVGDFNNWLHNNRKSEIISVAGYSGYGGQCNPTSHYLIIYRKHE